MASKKNTTKNKGKAAKNAAQNAPEMKNADLPPAEAVAPLTDAEQTPGPEKALETAPDASGRVPAVEEIAPPVDQVREKNRVAAEKTAEKPEASQNASQRSEGGKAGVSGPRLPGGISQRPMFAGNPYEPAIATVVETIRETHNIMTLRVVLDDAEAMKAFTFQPGQVGQLSVFGAGEATFVINSPPSNKEFLQFSVMRAGEVTDAIHRLYAGDKIGLRAPLGNFFPHESWKGKNVFFIGGGIGMAPIRTIMLHLLEHKGDYGKISLLYGARSPKDMAYSYELDDWKNNPDLDCTLCIDNPYENWGHKVGLIPKVLEEINPSPDNTVAVLCGPPIMIKFTLQCLQKLGFEPENIVTTLEKRMKCGIGICGRCNIGSRYVCVDGPVFTLKELDNLPADL